MDLRGYTVIYGGSFNPPHMGHQCVCLYTLEALGAKEIWVVPSHVHAFGKDLATFHHRVAMCKALVRPFGKRAQVLTIEKELAAHGSQGRTLFLLQALKKRFPRRKFALVIGSDILHDVHAWYRWDAIKTLVKVVVICREGAQIAQGKTLAVTPLAMPEVSSSIVRKLIHRRSSLTGWVPTAVAKHIARNRLYASK